MFSVFSEKGKLYAPQGEGRLIWENETTGFFTLRVSDIVGNQVAELFQGVQTQGKFVFEIPPFLSNGFYFGVLQGNSDQIAVKFVRGN